jgi:hypothetical protein
VTTLQGQALAQPEEIQRWEVALAAVEQADPAGDPNSKARLLTLRTEIQDGLDAPRRDKALLERLVDIRSAESEDVHDGSAADGDYADAFREAGIDLAGLSPAEAGARIKARPPSVALALARAMDDWASVSRRKRDGAAGAARLSAAARIADPDPWRNELRNALDQPDSVARLAALQAPPIEAVPEGTRQDAAKLLPLIYDELRKLAAALGGPKPPAAPSMPPPSFTKPT